MKVEILGKNGNRVVDLNRRRAIRLRCFDCSDYSPSEVRNCKILDCKLYPFRLGIGKQDPQKRSKAIRDYCLECMCGVRSEVKKCTCPDCSLYPYRFSRVDRSVEIKKDTNEFRQTPLFEGNK